MGTEAFHGLCHLGVRFSRAEGTMTVESPRPHVHAPSPITFLPIINIIN